MAKVKGVWGVNPTHPNMPEDYRAKPTGPIKPVKSKYKHGRPIKDDVSDGCAGIIIVIIISIITISTCLL